MKHYSSSEKMREKILHGATILSKNVGATLGPKGRNVILQVKEQLPFVTKDGVTVAQYVILDDPIENAGVLLLREAALQTNREAGDGTTTATILASEFLTRAQKYIAAGISPIELKRGMDKAVERVSHYIKQKSKNISNEDDIRNIATISSNNDEEIGELVTQAVLAAGKDGIIVIESGKSYDTTLDLIEGFRMPGGYAASAFVNDSRLNLVKFKKAMIFVTDERLEAVEDIMPALKIAAVEKRPLVIVAEEIEGAALASCIANTIRMDENKLSIVVIKAPRFGDERRELLKDLAVATGATFISGIDGRTVSSLTLKDLGSADEIQISRIASAFIGGSGDPEKISDRIETLKQEIKETDNLYECEVIQERISRLASGVSKINVGAPTEVEMIEKKHRIEDALEAVKSAQDEGLLVGGGTTLLRIREALRHDSEVNLKNDEQKRGFELVTESLSAPMRQMAINAGLSPDIIEQTILLSEEGHGYDFLNDKMVDMFEAGIIDPAKVTRCAVQNAVSVASTIIIAEHAIVET